ncbi:Oxidoreductase [Mycena sanguinolenta]|uniref:Oxidoreductase n=1 Tax=Mycena sanguinolenta TaxID=230812 RepID=A0A8H7DFB3_9AGAR|nr:Oxidoreductase [Mycena sanguinolenta]
MSDDSDFDPHTHIWSSFILSTLVTRQPPQPLGTVLPHEIEAKAKEKLKNYPESFAYGRGNAGSGTTYDANLLAFKRYSLVPRALIPHSPDLDSMQRNLTTRLLGRTYATPLVLGPIGTQSLFAEDAELSPAMAGKATGVPFVLSTVGTRSMEDVAEANGDGERWFQLYWPRTEEITLSLLQRAKNLKYTALVVTVDNFSVGWRTHDIVGAFSPHLLGVGCEVGRSDPVFMNTLGRPVDAHNQPPFPFDHFGLSKKLAEGDERAQQEAAIGMAWGLEVCSGRYRSWEELKWLRDHWEGPPYTQGYLARGERALDNGIDGIVVSNHGGRQIDGEITTMDALADIMGSSLVRTAQAKGKFTVFLDSGVRTGTDVLKAIVLGADAVFLGRAYLWASCVGGKDGVKQLIHQTMAEIDVTLALLGYRSLDEVRGRKSVLKAPSGLTAKM